MARYALVVGITDYTNQLSNLTKPATDAEAVKQVVSLLLRFTSDDVR